MVALDYYIRSATPFNVYTRAIGINNSDLWIITEQKTRKQTHDVVNLKTEAGVEYESGWVEWDLTFTKYSPLNLSKFKNTNTVVTKAVKKYNDNKKKTTQKKKEQSKSKQNDKQKLAKCDYKKLTYSKTKKTSDCVKTMQKILYDAGYLKGTKKDQLDGWFGTKTKEAVKSFQSKHKKDWELTANGKVDKLTWECMCGNTPEVKAVKKVANEVAKIASSTAAKAVAKEAKKDSKKTTKKTETKKSNKKTTKKDTKKDNKKSGKKK